MKLRNKTTIATKKISELELPTQKVSKVPSCLLKNGAPQPGQHITSPSPLCPSETPFHAHISTELAEQAAVL